MSESGADYLSRVMFDALERELARDPATPQVGDEFELGHGARGRITKIEGDMVHMDVTVPPTAQDIVCTIALGEPDPGPALVAEEDIEPGQMCVADLGKGTIKPAMGTQLETDQAHADELFGKGFVRVPYRDSTPAKPRTVETVWRELGLDRERIRSVVGGWRVHGTLTPEQRAALDEVCPLALVITEEPLPPPIDYAAQAYRARRGWR